MLSKQMATSNKLSSSSYYLPCTSQSVNSWTVFTSRMKNLAVLALPQVFFSRDTGLMFIPAMGGNGFQLLIPEFSVVILSDITQIRLTDDGHKGVEVANVETLPGNIDEELDHLGPLLLLRWLQKNIFLFHIYIIFHNECNLFPQVAGQTVKPSLQARA